MRAGSPGKRTNHRCAASCQQHILSNELGSLSKQVYLDQLNEVTMPATMKQQHRGHDNRKGIGAPRAVVVTPVQDPGTCKSERTQNIYSQRCLTRTIARVETCSGAVPHRLWRSCTSRKHVRNLHTHAPPIVHSCAAIFRQQPCRPQRSTKSRKE